MSSTIEQQLLDLNGPLMTVAATASLLGLTERGMMNAIYRRTPFGVAVAQAQVRIGRRVLFRTSDIAKLVS